MLDKRTSILLTQQGYDHLYEIAKQKKATISELIRGSVEKTYNLDNLQDHKKAVSEFLDAGKSLKGVKNADIKQLINHGRKY